MAFESPTPEYTPLLYNSHSEIYYESFPEPRASYGEENNYNVTSVGTRIANLAGESRRQIQRLLIPLHRSPMFKEDETSTASGSSTSYYDTSSFSSQIEEESASASSEVSESSSNPTLTKDSSNKRLVLLKRLKASSLPLWIRSCNILYKSQKRGKEWTLVALLGCLTAIMAFVVDTCQAFLFDVKYGFCSDKWYFNKRRCCSGFGDCDGWREWSSVLRTSESRSMTVNFLVYISVIISLATAACALTLMSRTKAESSEENPSHTVTPGLNTAPPDISMSVPASGSGVREVKLIIEGFWLEGYLTGKTFLIKSISMILSTASGLSIGKEGPFIHLGTSIAALISNAFGFKSEIGSQNFLSAGAASGLAVAFGAPISGVVFVLEDISITWTPKHLMLLLFSCIVSTLSLTILDPYGNKKTVLFEVNYASKWKAFELFVFAFIGIIGGALGATFVKACRFWARTYRRIPMIRDNPLLDTSLIAILTGLTSYWNKYTQLGDSELLSSLTAPCDSGPTSLQENGGCAPDGSLSVLLNSLALAFVIKGILTIVSFGLKVPAGIYIPSMAVGALLGKFIGHVVEELASQYPNASMFAACPADSSISCVTPGVYALIGAGVTMCGVTRLPVTLAIILFELTGSLDYMICFCIAIFVSKWIADSIEPASIYDLVSDLNSYPRLEESRERSTGTLGDLLLAIASTNIVIDITSSPIIPAAALQNKMDLLLRSRDVVTGLLLVEQDMPIGFIRTSDLQQALGKIDDIEHSACLLSMNRSGYPHEGTRLHEHEGELASYCIWRGDEVDLTSIVEQPPFMLEAQVSLVFADDCFRKLGVRCICVVQKGKYSGIVSRREFMSYWQEIHYMRREDSY